MSSSVGVIFDAAVVVDRRGYEFTLDGHVDRALFDALLASVSFDAAGAIDSRATICRR